jgi:hypothetical protein
MKILICFSKSFLNLKLNLATTRMVTNKLSISTVVEGVSHVIAIGLSGISNQVNNDSLTKKILLKLSSNFFSS